MSNKVTNPPAKILLASSTSMSLNDRFSKLPPPNRRQTSASTTSNTIKKGPKIIRKAPEVPNVKAKLANERRASARNRRLALQMANRPSVQAALKLKKKSIRHRIGGGVAFNKSANSSMSTMNTNKRVGPRPLNIRSRLGNRTRGAQLATRNLRARLGTNRAPSIKRRLGPIGNQQQQQAQKSPIKRLGNVNNNGNRLGRPNMNRGRLSSRGRSQNRSLNQSNMSNKSNNSSNKTNNFQRRRGNRRGGFNRRGPRQNQNINAPNSQEGLNKDLDTYMQKTKANLDADLDTYMKQAN